jgi:serine protease Do
MMDDAFGEVAEKLRRSTVRVGSGSRSFGSGVIWADRRVVTNAHVIGQGETGIELWNGRKARAHVIKADQRRDLAALEIDSDGLAAAWSGDSESLRPGELLIAVGNPMGFTGAVSTGVFHNKGVLPGFAQAWLMSDVRLAPGNSGGPLANARGEVVGINTMIAGGMALSVPSKSVEQFLVRVKQGGPGLGVVVRPVNLDGPQMGFLVLEIVPRSAAERASLLPGDILYGMNGRLLRSLDDFEAALQSAADGRLELEFRRGGSARVRRVVAHLQRNSPRAA